MILLKYFETKYFVLSYSIDVVSIFLPFLAFTVSVDNWRIMARADYTTH